jgi:uncharacterized protein
VIAEAGWLLDRKLGADAEARLCGLVVKGELAVQDLTPPDWERVTELVEQYGDHPLGAVDSSLVAVAERLTLDTMATLDNRHFRAVRPKHVEAFKIVP